VWDFTTFVIENPPKALTIEIRGPKWWDLVSFGEFWLKQTLKVWLPIGPLICVLEFENHPSVWQSYHFNKFVSVSIVMVWFLICF